MPAAPPPPPPAPLSAPPPPAPLPIKPIETSEIGNPGQIAKIAFDSRETGILDLSKSGLSNFPNGVIKLSDGSKVKKVILSGNALKTLPRDFSQFYEATEIDLSDNNFSHFAICFTDMYNLHTINLSRNKFETIRYALRTVRNQINIFFNYAFSVNLKWKKCQQEQTLY